MKGGKIIGVFQSRSLLNSAEKAFVPLTIGFINKGESLWGAFSRTVILTGKRGLIE